MYNVTFQSNYFVSICKMLELCNSLQVVKQKYACKKKPRHIHNYIILHSPIFICTIHVLNKTTLLIQLAKLWTHAHAHMHTRTRARAHARTHNIYIIPFTGTKFITSAHLFFFLPLLESVLPATKLNKNISI